jgi:pimeloyl-ACP methyl ester carboxylesterase
VIVDDDLAQLVAHGVPPLPVANASGYVARDGARIWYAAYGAGVPLVLLHGGLGNSENWSYQVPALVAAGYRPIVVDSRGHGRSTRDERPFVYERMADDVVAVIDALGIERVALIGWSDGATIALLLAMRRPERVSGVFFFACDMDPTAVKAVDKTSARITGRIFTRHTADYRRLSPTPNAFNDFVEAVTLMMRTEPRVTREQLAAVAVPVTVVHAANDEFIRRESSEELARTIPHARFELFADGSHFAPLQRPDAFTSAVLAFVRDLP